jgi:8-oxo-dGTP pyrophosphatase MutT (NUDIX family)
MRSCNRVGNPGPSKKPCEKADFGNPQQNSRGERPLQSLPLRTAATTLPNVKQNNWETVSSEPHFTNAHLEVVTEHVRTPARSEPRTWTTVHRKAAVIIAPMTPDGKIVLIHQERIPIRTAIWEMPSGQIDGPAQETAEQVGLRELGEEAGYELAKDGELIALGHYFTSPGFTDECAYFFLARPVQPCPNYGRDESESILDCRAFTVHEIRGMIAENEIRDANTLSLWARLWARGLLSG